MASLEPRKTSAMELFCENSYRFLTVKYFHEKDSSLMFDCVLITPLEISLEIYQKRLILILFVKEFQSRLRFACNFRPTLI